MFKQFMTCTASHNLNAAMSLYQINLPKQESVLSHTHTKNGSCATPRAHVLPNEFNWDLG